MIPCSVETDNALPDGHLTAWGGMSVVVVVVAVWSVLVDWTS